MLGGLRGVWNIDSTVFYLTICKITGYEACVSDVRSVELAALKRIFFICAVMKYAGAKYGVIEYGV